MNARRKKPVYAFIDSQNLNISTQRFGWKMDWKKFRQFLQDKYHVETAYMFIGYVPEFEDMYEQLHEAGYLIVLKPTFDLTKPRPEDLPEGHEDKRDSDDSHTKGNVDADLVLWAMKEMPNYSKAVIVSGDGDFYALVEYLASKKRLSKLLAPNAFYSGLYHRFDEYVERIDVHRKGLQYHDRRSRKKSSNKSNGKSSSGK